MRIASIVTLALGLGSDAFAAVQPASSCSAADVTAAISAADDGDTVVVPGGACTWTSVVSLSKAIALDGHGAAITFGAGGGLAVSASNVASTSVTGFTFNNGFVDGQYPIAVTTSSVAFRIYNNVLNDDGQRGSVTMIGVAGLGPGLIDHNTFTTAAGSDEVIHLLGTNSPSDAAGWSDDVVPGGPSMVFLENNVFVNSNPTYLALAEEAFYGARWVFRYNHLTFEGNDVHHGGLAGRWAEIYDNVYEVNGVATSLTNPLSAYWQFRGGSGVVFENVSSEAPCCQDPYPGAQFGPDCPSSDQCTGAWPIATQIGTGIDETTPSPVYVWGNTQTINGSTKSIQDSINYTNGTQSGPTPTSCTNPGNICDVVVTAVAPSSWARCQSAADVAAGCPVTYSYAPYTYPHPLDDLPASCFGSGCTASSVDAGVSGVPGDDPGGSTSSGRGGCGCEAAASPHSLPGCVAVLWAITRRRRKTPTRLHLTGATIHR